ncbi:peptidase U32 family protein [Gordonibacter massiliensis (ex Traore et al. 2017)]|uniref:peptidase U32 family protein n=1 Tax=Gordonibacter massiliensis (ex Traore et al. 2017) TaxID=1841863 RepID=UPI001C8CEBA1|nr:U32 family peptidase [Gordonibacter massiliensis (ex Traore et al. 2017)]MBX9033811.1 U32 family peptidase [Gordonibacter massiliensis (ex Traore et al. 2017)]
MNPLVPVNDRAYLERYVAAGGEEFYVGFHDPAWHERFGDEADLNRMTGFQRQANPYCFEDVLSIVDEVRELGKRIYVTFNASAYSQERLDFLFGYFERLHAAGATGAIVSVPEAVEPAADSGLEVVASTMCGVYNADIARFYRDLGCGRVIVPRDVGLSEIEAMAEAVPDVELEVFLMRNGCVFADGFCLGRHFQGRNALCWDVRHADREFYTVGRGSGLSRAARENNEAYGRFHLTACGLCAVYRLERAGVSAAKIVGRSDDPACVLRDIEAVVRNVEIANGCADEQEFLARMSVPPERARDCGDSLSCYYPEVRFPRTARREPLVRAG